MNLLTVVLGGGAALTVILGFLATWWVKAGRPRWRAAKTFVARWVETINGRDAEHNAYGHETSAAILPLAEQQAATQKQLRQLTTAVQTLVEHGDEIADVKARVASLERWKADVEHLHQVERITGNVAQAATFDAIGKVADRGHDHDVGKPEL